VGRRTDRTVAQQLLDHLEGLARFTHQVAGAVAQPVERQTLETGFTRGGGSWSPESDPRPAPAPPERRGGFVRSGRGARPARSATTGEPRWSGGQPPSFLSRPRGGPQPR